MVKLQRKRFYLHVNTKQLHQADFRKTRLVAEKGSRIFKSVNRSADQRHGHDCRAGTVLDNGLGSAGDDGFFEQIQRCAFALVKNLIHVVG